ncbi:MAG: DNA alkylation repair protein [Rhodoferax sp.]|nr:DNA alkylation repair protein [Rhodoferax sp.]MBP9929122.1 DNA alkylation repair protein [Rhodoferax sp.]HRA62157.1 DNA alkylation repair protein [Burkholderiaceae bacterium]
MAEPLKNQFGTEVPATIAAMIGAVHPAFPAKRFETDCLIGYDKRELMPRGRHIADMMYRHLPPKFPQALGILLASAEQPVTRQVAPGMAGFLFMPHLFFVSQYGLAHFEPSMQAQHALTQRFTAEFSIRPFLQHHPQQTLRRLSQWTQDPSEQVRRLVSEGSRPRLPWAPRLAAFQTDPRPVLQLLEQLRDDTSLYVRRSVANNLNDIGKDNPDMLMDTARRWLLGASTEREWIVRHALRWAVKQGNSEALHALGYGAKPLVVIESVQILPPRAGIGGAVNVAFIVRNKDESAQDLLIDLQVHYVKANGSRSAKVFKLRRLQLEGHDAVRLRKTVALSDLTTRKHYPGLHRVDALVNGIAMPLGQFELH